MGENILRLDYGLSQIQSNFFEHLDNILRL